MDLEKIENSLNETFLATRLPSGLNVRFNPKPGFSKTIGIMGVRFGSTDCVIKRGDNGDELTLPEGTAHFLEHKLFEDADGDVSDRFAANGANCNAGTGFASTSYMFSCTGKVPDNLRLLLSFVQNPYFTEKLVRKEQGIIQQEIRMYDDDPDWIIFFNLMKCLYREHPVRQNIAGTVDSIARITPDFLEQCYRAAYRPGNMVLVLVGGFDPEEILEIALDDASNRSVDKLGLSARWSAESSADPASSEVSARMIVARPKFLMGFKESKLTADMKEVERKEIITQMILDIIFGKSSPWFESLYADELVDASFSASCSGYGDFGFALLSADTDKPLELRDRLLGIIEEARERGIDSDHFTRIRNRYIGKYVRMFNSIESTAYSFLECFFRSLYPSDLVALIDSVTLDDLNERLRSHFDPRFMALSHVLPRDDKE